MGVNERNDPLAATDGRPRRRAWRLLLLTSLILIGLVLVTFLFRDHISHLWSYEQDLGNRFPPGVLTDYVPEDSQAVLAVNILQLRDSPSASRFLAPAVQQLIRRSGDHLQWMELLGLTPLDDIDSLQISFAPSARVEPLWLLRGRFDLSRVQIGPDKLQVTNIEHCRIWEYTDHRARRATSVAPVGDMLVASESRVRVQAALKQASNPRPIAVRDATLRELLRKVDRRQTLWVAASLKGLGSINDIEEYWLKLILRPLIAHAESVYGGINYEEDVEVKLHFRAVTEEEATQLEMSLQSIRDLAGEGASLLIRDKELLPLLRLLGAAQIHRKVNTIFLQGRLTADQLK
jgi:hypothetical protein